MATCEPFPELAFQIGPLRCAAFSADLGLNADDMQSQMLLVLLL